MLEGFVVFGFWTVRALRFNDLVEAADQLVELDFQLLTVRQRWLLLLEGFQFLLQGVIEGLSLHTIQGPVPFQHPGHLLLVDDIREVGDEGTSTYGQLRVHFKIADERILQLGSLLVIHPGHFVQILDSHQLLVRVKQEQVLDSEGLRLIY